jgi:hypothetical protein
LTILLSAPLSPHFHFSFYLVRSPITMRPFLFTWIGHPLQWDPFLRIFLKKQFPRFILYRAGRLEQLGHSRNPFRVLLFLSGRSPRTIRPLAKPFSCFSLHQAGRLEQLGHSRNPFRVLLSLTGRSPGTIRPLAKPFSRFILHRAGRLEQLGHSRNPFRVLLFLSGRSSGTIRPLAKPFSRFTLPIGQVAWNN